MSLAQHGSLALERWPAPNGLCSVVVAYEDNHTRTQALDLSSALIKHFWSEIELDATWWKFDHLADPFISREAANAAEKANVILFSAWEDKAPSAAIKNWVEQWVARRKEAGALAFLAAHNQSSRPGFPTSSVFGQYLKTVARRAGMDYLAPQGDWTPRPVKLAIEIMSHKLTPELDAFIHPNHEIRDYGIND